MCGFRHFGTWRARARNRLRLALCVGVVFASLPVAAAGEKIAAIADLSLEELGAIEVTSVSRQSERLLDAPASIYVITGEDIRRSGVRKLADALRLAPNLQVAQTTASTYGISARGFNNAIGNKLLVLIDGRTVYTPLFSGVFWDQQDVMLEDVERIEVISGPGATLWGANAVNGVINIITRSAMDTQGTLVSLGAGNRDNGAAVRYGAKIGESGGFRIYGKTAELQNTMRANDTSAPDGWQNGQVGFRADWRSAGNGYTVQGDYYSGKSEYGGFVGPFELNPITVSGANLLGRWTRDLGDGANFKLQIYFDHTERDDPLFYRPKTDIFDLDFQYGKKMGAHNLLWGGGYRYGRDEVAPGTLVTAFVPPESQQEWMNLFVQDEIALTKTLDFTPGIKVERNDYTGVELLPSARLAWRPARDKMVWGSASRAVRAPSRLDRDVRFPAFPPFLLHGGTDFQSEVSTVYELGYRAQPSRSLTYSITAFRHNWTRVRSARAGFPVVLENGIEGFINGVETWANLEVFRNWRLSGGFTTLREHFHTVPGSTDPFGFNNPQLANDPDQWWTVRSSHNLGDRHELDVIVRHVSSLPLQQVPHYTAVDARWGWKVSRSTELSLTLQNIFDREHVEFLAAPGRSVYERGIFLKALLRM
jgi:iron complex outermembrane receptor protein